MSNLDRHIEAAKSLAPVIESSKRAHEASLGLLVDAQRAASVELQGTDLATYEAFVTTLHKALGL
jgi:hypothetical protein